MCGGQGRFGIAPSFLEYLEFDSSSHSLFPLLVSSIQAIYSSIPLGPPESPWQLGWYPSTQFIGWFTWAAKCEYHIILTYHRKVILPQNSRDNLYYLVAVDSSLK